MKAWALAFVVGLAGCQGPATTVTSVRGHMLGTVGSVIIDRSVGPVNATISKSGESTRIAASGTFFSEPKTIEGDGFLEELSASQHMRFVRFGGTQDGIEYSGFGFVGETTANMPTTGSVNYSGEAGGVVEGSTTGISVLSGDLALRADFAPGGGNVSGRIEQITSRQSGSPVGFDVALDSASITGSRFSNGPMRVVEAGGVAEVGDTIQSNYDGSFYGPNAAEVGATFQLKAFRVPVPGGGGTQTIYAVGSFRGSSN